MFEVQMLVVPTLGVNFHSSFLVVQICDSCNSLKNFWHFLKNKIKTTSLSPTPRKTNKQDQAPPPPTPKCGFPKIQVHGDFGQR